MNVKTAKEIRRQILPQMIMEQAKKDNDGKRMSRGAIMRANTSLEAKPVVKTTKFKGRLMWLVQETLGGFFSIGQQMVHGGTKQDALRVAKKASKWTGTFFEAVQLKHGFNIGVLTKMSFRAIYKKTKGVIINAR